MARYSDRWTATQRRRWKALRRLVLARDGYRCRRCGRAGRLEVDHVVPPRRGGAVWDPANLQALCRDDHRRKSDGENRRTPTAAEAAWRAFVAELAR